MAEHTETIDITPDQSLLPKLGKGGYSIPQAIAELIDNAIDARIEGQLLTVSVTISKDEIVVADDGTGMNRQEVKDAMTLGRSRKRHMLGEFGLGLKTACTCLGKAFTVVTTKVGDPNEYEVSFDEDEWLRAEREWTTELVRRPQPRERHYTIVRITKLARFYQGLPETVSRDVARRFAPFLASGEVRIKVNRRACHPETYDLLEGTRREFSIRDELGNRIYGWYGLLKQGSNKGYYGFHTFRGNRMITTYDKIAIGEHPTISRIIGEIHLDRVPVTTDKREFRKETPEYQAAVKALKKEFAELVRQARQKASTDAVTKTVRAETEAWKDSIAQAMTAPELKPYTTALTAPPALRRDDDGPDIADVEVERRASPQNPSDPPEGSAPSRERTPKQTHLRRRHVVRVRNRTIEFRHEFMPLGENGPWYRYVYEPDKGLDIYTNLEFPAFVTTRDKAFYAAIHIAESIAHVMASECGLDAAEADDIKQIILRCAAAAKDEWTGTPDEPGALQPRRGKGSEADAGPAESRRPGASDPYSPATPVPSS